MQFPTFKKRFIEKFGVINFEDYSQRYMSFQGTIVWVLSPPACDGIVEIVLANQRFSDNVAVCKGCCGVLKKKSKICLLVRCDLEEGTIRVRELL